MRVLFWLATLLVLAGDSSAQNGPATWNAVHSEVLSVRKGEVPVALSYDEGLRLRHFHLRLSANHPFDAKLVRAHDGTILFSGRRDSNMQTMVDWGRGEIAHLTIEPRGRQTLQVVLEIAADPRDEGLEVYSFQVNRFLRLYESGEKEKAKRALENALTEDREDSMAAALLGRIWKAEGITTPPREIESDSESEGVWDEIAADQNWRRVRETIEQTWQRAGSDSALVRLDALRAEHPEAPIARGSYLLEGRIAMDAEEPMRATLALHRALDGSDSVNSRYEVYPLLIEANVALGNRVQAHAVALQAAGEAENAQQREQSARWVENTR